ncbi:GPR endopeptidase [Fodinisporobacter ferrooxydans]|uniref:Germination protease n=1 Tax=Fodinisporobacter ferrooxydans TaxID=2901836 RepID=A0ABY4CQU0_9BACL|nr:GPR endopeptidase [Alicyclobacillaceae bacterium MYW30-H2]
MSVRTDLALEAHQLAKAVTPEFSGVETEEKEDNGIRITRMHIRSALAAKQIGKQKGHYSTLEIPGLRQKDPELQRRVAVAFAEELSRFLHISKDSTVLVAGLGNWNVTPDALGPLVVENVFVTRHLFQHMPEVVEEGFQPLAAISPGVLGITGIETSEIIRGIVEKTKPDLVIAIDALASRSLERVNTTIQIADTGIHPGSGVGNRRQALNKETLGIPVIAVGVPTVVDAVTIVHDTMNLLMGRLNAEVPGNAMGQMLGNFNEHEKRQLIFELLQPMGQNLIVTPKEVDEFVEDVANILANGVNIAIHPAITSENVEMYTH